MFTISIRVVAWLVFVPGLRLPCACYKPGKVSLDIELVGKRKEELGDKRETVRELVHANLPKCRKVAMRAAMATRAG
jgi:hypothetical protein